MKQGKICCISFWRTIACIMVFIIHFGQRMQFSGLLHIFSDFGRYGVQLFFIISGFLIAKSYYDYGKDDPLKFYIKKAIAILPLYYLIIAYYFVMHTFVFRDIPQDPTGFGWLRYILPINYILPKTGTYFWDNLGSTWTIPYFVIAYAIIPLVLRFIKGWKSSLGLFCILVALAFASTRGYLFGWCSFLEKFPPFIIGVIIYYAIKEEKSNIVIFIFTILAVGLLVIGKDLALMYSLLFGVLIIATKDMSFKTSVANRVLQVFDKYSYTMYLAHGIIFIHILDRFTFNLGIRALIAVLGSIILTVIIKLFIEGPIQKLLNNLLINKKEDIKKDSVN